MPDESPSLTLRDCGIAFAMFLLGLYLVPLSVMHLDLSRIPGDLVDSRLNNYFLEHGYRWLTGQVASFWSAPFFFPAPQVMTLSDNHLGTLPLYAFFRFLHLDRETAYQLWMLALFALNYLSAALVFHRMRFNPVGAAAGAYFFAFSLPMSAQLGHIQLLPRFMVPLAFYFALRFLQGKKVRDLAATCACVVVQFYCVIYIGYFLSLGLAFFFVTYLVLSRDRSEILAVMWGSRQECSEKLLVMAGSGAALMPLMYPYYLRSIYSEPITWEVISWMLPRASSYIFAFNESLIWNWLSLVGKSLPMAHEHRLFVGLLPLLVSMLIPLAWIRFPHWPLTRIGKLFSLTLLGSVLLTLYVDGASLYRLIYWAPGVNVIRAPVRIILVQSFLVGGLLALAVTFAADLLKDRPAWLKTLLACAFLTFTICDQGLVHPDRLGYGKAEAQSRVRGVVEQVLARDPQAKLFIYLSANPLEERAERNLDAMLAAQSMGIYTVNGHSGYEPRDNRPDPRKPNFCPKLREWLSYAKVHYREQGHIDLLDHLLVVGDLTCIGAGADSWSSGAGASGVPDRSVLAR